jgi:hypothetical protein
MSRQQGRDERDQGAGDAAGRTVGEPERNTGAKGGSQVWHAGKAGKVNAAGVCGCAVDKESELEWIRRGRYEDAKMMMMVRIRDQCRAQRRVEREDGITRTL